MVVLFWSALLLGLYPYVLYPVLVWVAGRLRDRRIASRADHLPAVTVVIAAYNEARHIAATVRNKLAQDYPAERLEVLVISDESVDGTDALVSEIAASDARVRLLRQVPRQGKTSALNWAVPQARGEIVVFSDANSIYRLDALRMLASNFADPAVGYVTGHMLYVNPDGSLVGDGCSAYMRYENAVRAAETRVGSVVGVDGGVDAVRKALYQPMRADQLPDFVLPLNVVQQGYRVVYEPRAALTEETLSSESGEFRMRVRVGLRAFWALWDKRALMNPFRRPLFAWQMVSHKLLRYLSFLPLAVAAVTNVALLSEGPIYRLAFAAQVTFFLLALLSRVGPESVRRLGPVRYCAYFLLLNVASAVAFFRFLRGQKQVLWQPRTG